MTRIAVLGVGAVGARVARQLLSSEGVDEVALRDDQAARLQTIAASLGDGARIDDGDYGDPIDADVVVLAGPASTHVTVARAAIARGQAVVSTSDAVADVRGAARPGSRGPRARRGGGRRCRLRPRSVVRAGRATPRPASTWWTRSTWPRSAPAVRPAPVSTTGPWPVSRSTGATVAGSSARQAAGGSCAGSPTRSGPRTATGPPCADALLLVPAFAGVDPGHRPGGGQPTRPFHRPAADAATAPSRGRARGPSGSRSAGAGAPTGT